MATALAMVAWLLSGQWHEKWQLLKMQPAALLMTALVLWMFLSASWSEGTAETIRNAFGVQWQLLLIPIIVTLTNHPRWTRWYWTAFAAGMAVLLAHVIFMSTTSISIPWVRSIDPAGVFFNPLPQSIGLAIFAGWCLHQIINRNHSAPRRWLACAGLLVACYAVLHVSQQRLGYIALLLGFSTVILLSLTPKKRWWALAATWLVLFGTVALSTKIQNRIELARQDIQSYNFKSNYSSLGARLHMWYTSVNAIEQKPIAGHGLGSYPVVAQKGFNDPVMCDIGCRHPHNQYIFYGLEYGMVGLTLFLAALMLAAWAHRAMQPASVMPLTILVVFMVSGLADTTLWYRGFIYLFVPLLGLAMIRPAFLSTDIKKVPPGCSPCAPMPPIA